MRYPSLINAYRLLGTPTTAYVCLIGTDRYVPARALGYGSLRNRIRCAWLVFTGRADALIWPGQDDGGSDVCEQGGER